jgi:nucleotide-binding universal stress UspA family protein
MSMKILIAVDRSEYAEIVLEHGLDQAARHPDSELHIATALDGATDADAARTWLDALVRDDLDAFGLTDRRLVLHVVRGRAVPAVAALASELAPDLLVIGQFQVPSVADTLIGLVECPTLVIGIDGPVLQPQCPACRAVRQESEGERLFCVRHAGDRMVDLAGRLPPATSIGSRIW